MAKTMTPRSIDARGLDDDRLRWMMRNMLLQRTLDNRGFQLNRQGKIPFATGSEGHEGIHAGAAVAFACGRDVLVPYYRDVGFCLGIGMTALEVLLGMFARAKELQGGRQFPNHYTNRALGLLSISSIIAAHCPHAVGVAYAIKLRREADRVVFCTFGDGATSSGEWHESMNFAAVHGLPIVFLCENNEWAISTPRSRQMKVEHVADKAAGYGMPGAVVDGSDPLAVYGAVREARERAARGDGPTLVEAKCYRFLSHTTDDDDRTYRTRDEIDAQRHLDPIPRFKNAIMEAGVMTPTALATMEREVLAEVNRATDEAEAEPYPASEDLYRNVVDGSFEPWR